MLVSCFPAISATGGPPFCVPCLFYLVKERFILSKRWSLLVLYIIVFHPLWMLICTIKPFLTYSQCLYISVESFFDPSKVSLLVSLVLFYLPFDLLLFVRVVSLLVYTPCVKTSPSKKVQFCKTTPRGVPAPLIKN